MNAQSPFATKPSNSIPNYSTKITDPTLRLFSFKHRHPTKPAAQPVPHLYRPPPRSVACPRGRDELVNRSDSRHYSPGDSLMTLFHGAALRAQCRRSPRVFPQSRGQVARRKSADASRIPRGRDATGRSRGSRRERRRHLRAHVRADLLRKNGSFHYAAAARLGHAPAPARPRLRASRLFWLGRLTRVWDGGR